MESSTEILRQKLNLETGRISWRELRPHFVRGALIRVAAELDLVEVAVAMATDDAARMKQWLDEGAAARADAADAACWEEQEATFWAVVVAPWVLAQEVYPQA